MRAECNWAKSSQQAGSLHVLGRMACECRGVFLSLSLSLSLPPRTHHLSPTLLVPSPRGTRAIPHQVTHALGVNKAWRQAIAPETNIARTFSHRGTCCKYPRWGLNSHCLMYSVTRM